MAASLKHRTISGIKWQMVNKILQKVISVGTFAVLARILEPSVFGLFAMAFVAIDGFQVFKSFGIDSALIQRKEKLDEATQTAFVIIQGTGFLLCALCYLFAPLAAKFFHTPELASIVRALGIVFIFTCFSKVPSTLLTKQMRFDLISIIELIGAIVNCTCAIIFALMSPSVWSLVWAYIMKQVTITALSWYFSGFRLRWHFDFSIAKQLFGYGKFMVGLSILWYIGDNISNVVVGRVLGVAAVGYYALASNVGNFINTHFTQLISATMFPAYSAIQNDPDSIKRAYLKTIKFVSIMSFPFAVGLMLLSKEFVLTLYGPKWLPIVPLITLYGVAQLVVPIKVCSNAIFLGCGKPKYSFNLMLYPVICNIPLLIYFAHLFGIVAPVLSGFVVMAIFTPINIGLVRKIVGFSMREFFAQLRPSIYCSIIMFTTISVSKMFIHLDATPLGKWQHLPFFLTLVSVGLLSYVVAFFFLDRKSTLEIKSMLFPFEKVLA